MRVVLSWLCEFADLEARASDPGSVAALGQVMDDLGMVVEGTEFFPAGLDGVVVCRVVEISAIPGADRIRRVVVDAGALGAVEVVCGAANFEVGDLVPLATVGTVLPGGMVVGKRAMRGVESHGMLCSGSELGLSEDSEGLLVLDPVAAPAGRGPAGSAGPAGRGPAGSAGPAGRGSAGSAGPAGRGPAGSAGPAVLGPGTPLASALGIEDDVVYDLAIETNRPDAMCVAGVARDLAARLGLEFAIPEPGGGWVAPGSDRGDRGAVDSTSPGSVEEVASLRVEADDLCPRFVARVLCSVTVTASPAWMRRRLALAGMRPINSVVDASNYVMLELGQPTHPYDLDRLGGHGLTVRRARPGETLVTLDGVERVCGLDLRRGQAVDDCLICDAEGTPVGIAGVMGGSSSEIGPDTRRVLLEAAWFDPMAIARTSRRLGLRSEASARFERGCDWGGIERAVARLVELLARHTGGVALPGSLEHIGALPERPRIRLRTARVNAILGTELTDHQVRRYLEPLGFTCSEAGSGSTDVVVPTWRPDCSREIDLIEEVARHHGYSAIPRTRHLSPRVGGLTKYQRDRRLVRATLVGLGASEAWTSSLVPPDDHALLGPVGAELAGAVLAGAGTSGAELAGAELAGAVLELEDPLAREESTLRASLIPGLTRAVAANAAHQEADVRLFEVGRVFGPPAPGDELPSEREMMGLALALPDDDAAAAVRAWRCLASALRLVPVDLEAASPPGMHPTRSARLVVPGGAELGAVGELHPALLEAEGLGGRRVGWLELDLAALHGAPRRSEQVQPVSRFPSAQIDLAFVVDEAVPAGAVEATLGAAAGTLLAGIVLFDVYRGAQLGPGRRSLAYRLSLAALDHTLTEAELARLRSACVAAVESAHQAQLRG
jgi:phenylalanyl-tRNA synthetase beta chain